MSRERLNIWSWHGLPWSSIRPRDQANDYRTSLFAFLWVGSLVAIRIPSQVAGLPDWTAWPLAALSFWCGWLFVRAFHRMLREADELMRTVQLEGLALGFGAGLICGMTVTALMPASPFNLLAFLAPMVLAYLGRVIAAARQSAEIEE